MSAPTIEVIDPPAGEGFKISGFAGTKPADWEVQLERAELGSPAWGLVAIFAAYPEDLHVANLWGEGSYRASFHRVPRVPATPRPPRMSGYRPPRTGNPRPRAPHTSNTVTVDWP